MTIGMMLLPVLAFAYLLPSFMAYVRGHQNLGAIFLVNLVLGWTVLGWIAALIWAATTVTATMEEIKLQKKRLWWNP